MIRAERFYVCTEVTVAQFERFVEQTGYRPRAAGEKRRWCMTDAVETCAAQQHRLTVWYDRALANNPCACQRACRKRMRHME